MVQGLPNVGGIAQVARCLRHMIAEAPAGLEGQTTPLTREALETVLGVKAFVVHGAIVGQGVLCSRCAEKKKGADNCTNSKRHLWWVQTGALGRCSSRTLLVQIVCTLVQLRCALVQESAHVRGANHSVGCTLH